MKLEVKISRLLEELRPLSPLGVRVVGSRAATDALSSSAGAGFNAPTSASDVDLHLIVRDLGSVRECFPLLGIAYSVDLAAFDVFASKVTLFDELFSIHVYTPDVFDFMCGFEDRTIRMFRTTIGRTHFAGYGARSRLSLNVHMKELVSGGFSVDYHHTALTSGGLHVLPYQSMAMTGRTLVDNCGITDSRAVLAGAVNRQLIEYEGVASVPQYLGIFGDHISTLESHDLARYCEQFSLDLERRRAHYLGVAV